MGDREQHIREYVVEVIRRTVVNDEYWNNRFVQAAIDAAANDIGGSFRAELAHNEYSVAHAVGLGVADAVRAMVNQGLGEDERDPLRIIVMDILDLGSTDVLVELGRAFMPNPDDVEPEEEPDEEEEGEEPAS